MTEAPAYTQTNESITVMLEGNPYTIKREQDNWDKVRLAIFNEDWDSLGSLVSPKIPIENWASGEFTVEDNLIMYDGEPIAQQLNERILEMAEAGSDPSFMFAFWERLQQNPSSRSVEQLYPFMAHKGIPIVEGGYFLAYKGVNADFTDCHSGKVDNSPGVVNEMKRNRISDDPNHACHFGFHVGDESYATSFGSRTVVVRVDPADVVCIPFDAGQRKMRVCKYEVIGIYGGQLLPNTSFKEDKIEDITGAPVDEEDVVEEEAENTLNLVLELPCKPGEMNRDTARATAALLDIEGRGRMSADDLRAAIEIELINKPSRVVADVKPRWGAPPAKDEDLPDITSLEEVEEEVRQEPAPVAAVTVGGWEDFHKLSDEALALQNLGDLRKYASKVCKIVGASKLRGGKSALLTKLVQVRADLGVS